MTFPTSQNNQSSSLTSSRFPLRYLSVCESPRAAEHQPLRRLGGKQRLKLLKELLSGLDFCHGKRPHYSRDTDGIDVHPPPLALFVCQLEAEAIDYSNTMSHGGTRVCPSASPPSRGGGFACILPVCLSRQYRSIGWIPSVRDVYFWARFGRCRRETRQRHGNERQFTDHVSIISDTVMKQP